MISEKAIREFKAIWLKETGEEIDDRKALAEATRLLVFFDAIYRPLKKEWVTTNDHVHPPTEDQKDPLLDR
jgi:hypothetical protein